MRHIFEEPDRAVTLEADLECEPEVMEGPAACPVCKTEVGLDALEHSIRSRPLRAVEGEPQSFVLLCSMPCFNESCPAYLKLTVTVSEDEFDAWRKNPTCRFDHSYFRDGRPITLEAQASESITAPAPHACPVCREGLDLAALMPLSELLISGVPLPQPTGPPQHRVTAYAACPNCRARLTCHCSASAEEVIALRAGSETSGEKSQ